MHNYFYHLISTITSTSFSPVLKLKKNQASQAVTGLFEFDTCSSTTTFLSQDIEQLLKWNSNIAFTRYQLMT
jgi:hypothetical protein